MAQLKGPSRPINKLKDRIGMMTALRCVDEVRTFSTAQELEEMIKSIAPDVMMVGSDWEGKQIIGADYAAEVLFFRRIDGYSTTKTIEDISYR